MKAIDHTIEVVNLHTFDPSLAETSTPDWVIYCKAASAKFDALVTRDKAQLDQLVEMYVLSRLHSFTVVAWKKPIEDPVREWGQLLAYLPELKKHLQQPRQSRSPDVILLPAPTLSEQNIVRAEDKVGRYALKQGISHKQSNDEALAEINGWLLMRSNNPHEFDDVLGLRNTT